MRERKIDRDREREREGEREGRKMQNDMNKKNTLRKSLLHMVSYSGTDVLLVTCAPYYFILYALIRNEILSQSERILCSHSHRCRLNPHQAMKRPTLQVNWH